MEKCERGEAKGDREEREREKRGEGKGEERGGGRKNTKFSCLETRNYQPGKLHHPFLPDPFLPDPSLPTWTTLRHILLLLALI